MSGEEENESKNAAAFDEDDNGMDEGKKGQTSRSPKIDFYWSFFDFLFVLFRFNYGLIMKSDASEKTQRELLDMCTVSVSVCKLL